MKLVVFILCIVFASSCFSQVEENLFWLDSQQVVRQDTVKQTIHNAARKLKTKPAVVNVPIAHNDDFYSISFDSLFSQGDGTTQNDIYSKNKTASSHDYQFAVILLIMLLYVTWITSAYHKELRENITVMINNNLGQQIYRDREFSANIFKLLTFINFALLAGIFIYLAAIHFHVEMLFNELLPDVGLCVAIVFAAYFMKGLAYRIADGLYHFGPAIYFFRFNSLVVYQLLGIGLMPLIILSVFAKPPVNDWALSATIVLILIAFIVRLAKGISVIGMLKGFRFIYFLLYICALEIAPVLIVYKVFSTWA